MYLTLLMGWKPKSWYGRVVPHFPDSFRNAAKNVVIRYTYIGGIFSTYGFG